MSHFASMTREDRCARDDPLLRVTHVGNNPYGQGGIARVILTHLRRSRRAICVDYLVAYRQDGKSTLVRQAPAFKAAWHILRSRAVRDRVFHFHLSRRGSYVREGVLLWLAWLRGHRNLIVTLHGSSLGDAARPEILFLGVVLRAATMVHVLGEVYRQRLSEAGISKVVVIPNDVDLGPRGPELHQREPVVIFLGEVGHRKGVDLLLEAWHEVAPPGWRADVWGPLARNEGAALLAQMDRIPNIAYMGVASAGRVGSLLRGARVLVLPSRAENLPMAICEAMAGGCVVVATDVGAVSELVPAAWLCTPGSASDLASRLSRAVSCASDSKGDSLGAANRLWAEQHLSFDVVTDLWVKAYGSMCH